MYRVPRVDADAVKLRIVSRGAVDRTNHCLRVPGSHQTAFLQAFAGAESAESTSSREAAGWQSAANTKPTAAISFVRLAALIVPIGVGGCVRSDLRINVKASACATHALFRPKDPRAK